MGKVLSIIEHVGFAVSILAVSIFLVRAFLKRTKSSL
jgi:hypothetical protein